MELLQLYYFQVTARCEHISAAARKLQIAQPALSQTIRRLEHELGTPLFDRIGRHIQLNDFGRIFLKYTDTALGALSDARAELADAMANPWQKVTLCVQAASSLLPDILGKFTRLYPKIQFQITQSTAATDNIPDIDLTISAAVSSGNTSAFSGNTSAFSGNTAVVSGDTPVFSGDTSLFSGDTSVPSDNVSASGEPAASAGQAPAPDKNRCILLTEPLVIALPSGHPLTEKKSLTLKELASWPFASLHKSSNLFQITRYYCALAGFEPRISLSCDNPQAFRELLGLNMGIAMIPEITWPKMEASGIVTRPISDICCRRDIVLTWHKNRYLSSSALLLRDFLKDYFLELAAAAAR